MKKDFSHIFEHDYQGFDNFCQEVLQPMFGNRIELMSCSEDFIATTGRYEQADAANILSIRKVAEINPAEYQDNFDEIYVFDITMRDNCRIAQNRVGIQQLIRSQLMLDTNAFMLFHYENPKGGRSWRFSYFYKSATDSMDRKRYTYVFGEGQSSKTANERFNLLSDALHGTKTVYNAAIEDAFSVEKLSDEFFYKYLGFYASFVKYITGEPTTQEEGDHKITERTFRETLAKMDALGQNDTYNLFNTSFSLAYPDKEARTKAVRDYVKKMMGRLVFLHFLQRKGWMCGDRKFMLHLLQNTDHKDDFLDRVLEPLFFAVLNTHSKERRLKVEKHNAKIASNKNKVEWDVTLIEAWSSIPYLNGGLFEEDQADGCRCIFPYEYFNALFDFFSQYNFTVDENDPSDAEVGVDPEMLSKIFESLLEDNKDKGAFYTPKEIVSYMCRSALSSYLKEPLASLGVQESAVDAFVNNPQEHHDFTEEQRTVLLDSLRTVRICDPAIGSGAFPVGMMNLLYQCRRSLEGSDARTVDIKTDIIQHNIFGVDIEQGAVDIARLRFWLALVVDEEEAHALPNLDYRIVRGNSLLTTFNNEYINLGEDKSSNRTKLAKLKKQLAIAQGEYYNLSGEEKLRKEIEIKLLLLDIIAMRLDIDIKVADEVAADNPTLFDVPRNARQTKAQKKAIALAEQKRKSRIILKGLRDKLNGNKLSLIERARTDINFFDWGIIFSDVFAEKKGFDVVIGNPPYVSLQAITDDSKLYASLTKVDGSPRFATYNARGDLYPLFVERGMELLCHNGHISYIMPNKWETVMYGQSLRQLFLDTNIKEIVDFGDYQIFESATTYTCIVLIQNAPSSSTFANSLVEYVNLNDLANQIASLRETINKAKLTSDIWHLSPTMFADALYRLDQSMISLEEYVGGESYRGILSGLSAAFNISIEKAEELKSRDVRSLEIIRPFLQGRGLVAYGEAVAGSYLVFMPKGFTLEHMGLDTLPPEEKAWQWIKDNYPAVAEHLLPFAEKGKKRTDKGDYWWELRACSYYDRFSMPKLFYQVFQTKPCFVYDDSGTMCNNSMFFLSVPDKSLLALLCSKLGWRLIKDFCPRIQNGRQLIWDNFKRIPVPRQLPTELAEHAEQMISLKAQNADTTALEDEIDFMVYKLYNLTYDEVLVVDPETPIKREDYEKAK